MRIYRLLLLCFLLFFALPSIVSAQFISKDIIISDTSQVHVLNTENGDRFVGRVTRIENTTIFFLFQKSKELEFTLTEIRSIVLFEKSAPVKGNDTSSSNQNPDYVRAKAKYDARQKNRNKPVPLNGEETLFFSPTSYTLGKGKKEFRSTMVFYNRLDLGLTDNLDIGFDLMPLLASNIIAARIKAGIPLGSFVNVGFGSSIFTVLQPGSFSRNVSGTTHTYGTVTLGTKEKFMNIGYGYAFPFRPEFTDGSTILTFGGAYRIANHWKLVADFILMGDEDQADYYSLGASWFNNKNRFDFGINTLRLPDDNFIGPIVPIPFVSYARSFGKNK